MVAAQSSGSNPHQAGLLRRIAVLSILIVGGFVSALIIGEISLRLAGFANGRFYQLDPVLGYTFIPGAKGWWRREGVQFIRINSKGLRDIEHSVRKPPGVFRIAVLGDSFAAALQVPIQDTFWWIAQQQLRQNCPGTADKRIEFINFGVHAYGLAQELLMLRRRVWAYSPDMVIVAFYPGNDVWDESPDLRNWVTVPYFHVRDGRLELDTSFAKSRRFQSGLSWARQARLFVSDHLRVVQLINDLKDRISALSREPGDHVPSFKRWVSHPDYFGLETAAGKDTPVWRNAWRVTRAILAAMHREATAHGAKFLVVALSFDAQVYPDPKARAKFARRFGVKDLFYANHRIVEFGRQDDYPVLDLAPAMQRYADIHHVFLHGFRNTTLGFGHWNASGHRVAGNILGNYLCATLSEELRSQERAVRREQAQTTSLPAQR